jgi:hypothetical protein
MTLSSPVFDLEQETITISDATTYTDPTRESLALYFQVYKMDEDSNETEIVVTADADPDTVTQWTFAMTIDGWYKGKITIIEDFELLINYVVDNVVFYEGGLYQNIQASSGILPTDEDYFTPISFTIASTTGNNLTLEYFDFVFVEYGKICAGNAVGAWANSSNCGACSPVDLMASWLQRDAMVYAIERFYAISQFSKAEELARKLENLCESC